MRKIAFSVITLIAIGSIAWFIFGGTRYAINFILAAASSTLVIYTSYLGYAKLIKASAIDSSADIDDVANEEEDEEDEKITKKQAIVQTYKGWLFPLRLIAYVVLVFVFLALSSKDILFLAPFLTGLGVMPIAVLAQVYFTRKSV